jgi:hypothetical protein
LGADLIDPSSFLSTPFASQPIFMAGCASLIEWRGNGNGAGAGLADDRAQMQSLSANRHFLFGMAAQRSFAVCREALSRMRQTWRGVSWLCSTLESRAAQEADVNLAEEGTAKVSTRDVGYVKRVSEIAEGEGTEEGIRCECPRLLCTTVLALRLTVPVAVLGLTVSGNTDETPGMLSVLQVGFSHAPDSQSPDQYGSDVAVTNVHHHPMDADGQVVDHGDGRASTSRMGTMGGTPNSVAAEASASSPFQHWDRDAHNGRGEHHGHDSGHHHHGTPDLISVSFPFSVAQSSISLLDSMPEAAGASTQQLWGIDPQAVGNLSVADWLGLQLLPTTTAPATPSTPVALQQLQRHTPHPSLQRPTHAAPQPTWGHSMQ